MAKRLLYLSYVPMILDVKENIFIEVATDISVTVL